MAKICRKCQIAFANWAWVEGKKKNLQHRQYCLKCSPFGQHNTRRLGELRRSQEAGILCRRCAQPLTAKQRKGRVCWACWFRIRSQRRLSETYEIVGYACWRCGYSRGAAGQRILDFHHVDRQTKLFNLDCRNVVNLAWTRVLAEMKKCVLLCANCHREVETGLISKQLIEQLHADRWQRYERIGKIEV